MWSIETLEWIDIELTSFCNIRCKGCFRVMSEHADKILNKTYLDLDTLKQKFQKEMFPNITVSYTHLRAHETREDLVCRVVL